jgi:two-component system, OmpR family, sensor kinase
VTLRKKLMTAFAGLLAVSLLVAGAALFATLRWQATAADMETHYQRSLLLQRVRAGTFQALKEVDDALTGDYVDARADFERALSPVTRDFAEWASLADTHAEQGEVARVRQSHQLLIRNAVEVFDLIPRDRAAALRLADDEVDTGDYERFRLITERAVEADRQRRRSLRAETEQVRTTTQIMLGVSALSILSLALLIAAYLFHDMFAPLRELAETARRLSVGDLRARADEDRDDEIGNVAKALNILAASMNRRAVPAGGDGANWQDQPSHETVHCFAAKLQACARQISEGDKGDRAEALTQINRLAAAMAKFSGVGFPLDLELEPVDLAALVHSILGRHRSEFAERAVSLDLSLATDLRPVLADRLKLREAIGEAVRNALAALPAKGGRLGFRIYAVDEAVRIEVADSGSGMDEDLIDQVLGQDSGDGFGGLAVARAILERHGGALALFSQLGKGTVAQFTVPYR